MGSMETQNVPALFKDSGAQLRPTDSLWEFGHSVINILSFIFSKKFHTSKIWYEMTCHKFW